MTDVRSIFVIGLGSMGKRRIRNLQRLEIPTLVGYDPREDRRTEVTQTYGVETVPDVARGYASQPDAVVISTPPDWHVRYAREAVEKHLPFFMEADVLDDEMTTLLAEAVEAGVVAAPSCTMRFHPSVRTLKRLIEAGRIGKILAYTHHSGQYLPDWHPWEDYRRFYAGQRRTGACREIVPFELEWLTWVIGPATKVAAMKGKISTLDVDIDDVYQLVLAHANGALGHLLVDVVARAPIRRCTILGSSGTLVWDWSNKRVQLYESETKEWTSFDETPGTVQPGYVHTEEPYVDEMRAFLAAVRGDAPWPYPLHDDIATLALLRAAEQSSDDGRHVPVAGGRK